MNINSYFCFAHKIIIHYLYPVDKTETNDMDKNILKTVIADNQIEIPRYKVIPRDFTFEEFGNYVFTGIRRAGKSYLLYQRMQQLLAQEYNGMRCFISISKMNVLPE